MPARPMRVVILGGSGVFGSSLATLLARDGHQLWIAGRRLAPAQAVAIRVGGQALAVDWRRDPTPLFAVGPEVLVDAAGPFQEYGDDSDPYRLARLCLARGVDYLDLSDDGAFTAGIAALDAEARSAGRVVISGASSVPGLSASVVAQLAQGLDSIDLIDTALLPGNKAPRGRAVMASILGQVGRPMRVWRGGGWQATRGWSDRRVYALDPSDRHPKDRHPKERHPNDRRAGYLIPVPDLTLFPQAFGARSVVFRAGMELGVMNAGLRALSILRRIARLPIRAGGLTLLHRLASILAPFGTDRGFMAVCVVGRRGGQRIARTWQLTATGGDGPLVPAVAARALLRSFDRLPSGARPCLTDLPLTELEAAMADLAITTATKEAAQPTLFQSVLQDCWADLPPSVQRLHSVVDVERFSGTATVTRGRSWVARLAAWVFGFPAAGSDVPVTVTKTRTDRGEIWQRDFAGRVFRSTCSPARAPGRVCERFGPFAFELDLPVADGAMSLPVRRAWLLGLPLPHALLPVSEAREYEADGVFHFDVALDAPLGGGRIVHYRGTLTPDSA